MKLPALWMLAAFAAGIGIAERWPGSLRLWLVAAAVAILLAVALALFVGAGFARRHFVTFAW
ncbi:MAG: hypothetical protein WA886_02045, partial [Candidatus Acidiferrales bacterium]